MPSRLHRVLGSAAETACPAGTQSDRALKRQKLTVAPPEFRRRRRVSLRGGEGLLGSNAPCVSALSGSAAAASDQGCCCGGSDFPCHMGGGPGAA